MWEFDNETGDIFEVRGEPRLTYEEEIDLMKIHEMYCGQCNTASCMVEDGSTCCHELVKYGHCAHEPLPCEEEDFSIIEERPEDGPITDEERSYEPRARRAPRERTYRPQRPRC